MSRNKREGRIIIGRLNKHDVAFRKIARFGRHPKEPMRMGLYDADWLIHLEKCSGRVIKVR